MDIFSKILAGFMAFITAIIAIFTGGNGGEDETTTTLPSTATTITTTLAEPTTLSQYLTDLKVKAERNRITYASYIDGIIAATNAYRKELGLTELTVDADLSLCASVRAQEIADSGIYSHVRPNNSDPSTLIDEMNYKYYANNKAVGENLAKGFNDGNGATDGANVVNAWRDSPAHNANLTRTVFTRVGAGLAVGENGTTYWVMYFYE